MSRRPFFRRVPFTSLLLVVGLCLGVQTGFAQSPSIDADDPVASLQTAEPTSDHELVTMATSLMRARAQTKISFSQYQEGVSFFQEHHPGFYGNFFGDPFYATYDVRYYRLARERLQIDNWVNPQNEYGDATGFRCNPYRYDPAFGGWCRGGMFAGADFFMMPRSFETIGVKSGGRAFLAGLPARRSGPGENPRSVSERRPNDGEERRERCSEEETSCEASVDPAIPGKDEWVRPARPVAPEMELPELGDREIETLSREEWAEIGDRLRTTLSPEERQAVIDRFEHTVSVEGERAVSSRRDWSPREEDRVTSVERKARELERRLQRRRRNRTEWNRTSNAPLEQERSRENRDRIDRVESERANQFERARPGRDRSDRDRSDRDRSGRDRSRSESSGSGR